MMTISKDTVTNGSDKKTIETLNEFGWDILQLADEITKLRGEIDDNESDIGDKDDEIYDLEKGVEKLELEVSDLKEQVGLCTQCGQLKNLNQ